MSKISIKQIADKYAHDTQRVFSADRLNTVGASEIGQCLRKNWFLKNETPKDPSYVDRYGAKLRGNLIEDHFVVPAIRNSFGPALLFAGSEQRTIVDGYLSATSDGLLTGVSRDCLAWLGVPDIGADCLVVEIKSLDPRVDIKIEKPEHSFQVQAQIGLLRHATEHKPAYALISYVDASFLDDVREFAVPFDPAIYAAAQARSRQVMTETDPLRLPPEGKLSGGDECCYCAWASHCAAVTVAGIPKNDDVVLGENAEAELWHLRNIERHLSTEADCGAAALSKARQDIKDFLRANGVRKFHGEDWAVSWSATKGRETIDTKAIEASGFDLSPFKKIGDPSDRLVIK